MDNQKPSQKTTWTPLQTALITVLVILLGIMAYVALKQGEQLRRHNVLNIKPSNSQPKAQEIQVWMTFDYINHLFHLPTQYLSNSLPVKDARYPNLSIQRYAREIQSDPAYVLMRVQNTVASYTSSSGMVR